MQTCCTWQLSVYSSRESDSLETALVSSLNRIWHTHAHLCVYNLHLYGYYILTINLSISYRYILQDPGNILDCVLFEVLGPFHVLHLSIQHIHEAILHQFYCLHYFPYEIQETILQCKKEIIWFFNKKKIYDWKPYHSVW